jgi:SAM-dependent methyltransferase
MADAWADYDQYKTDSALSERYYAFVTACFEQGIRAVVGSRRVPAALDVACGSGDSTAVLANYAERVEGIDLSAALIDKARARPQLKAVEFHHGDFLAHPLGGRYDLITSAWFHNFVHSEADQQRVLRKLAAALSESGAVVFLFPSDSFTSPRTGRYVARLTWRQAWYERTPRYTRGVFSFRDSPWQIMTCWQPLYLLELYSALFDLQFLDTKKLCVEGGFLDEQYLSPPFEVMYGRKRAG